MAELTYSQLADALKLYYTDKKMMVLSYEDHPLLAMLPKDTEWTGEKHIIPIQASVAVAGRSATFATAQANAAGGTYERWELTTTKDFGVLQISNEAILASANSPMRAFVEARRSEIDGILTSLGSNLAMQMYRNGGMARGQRASASTNVITLTNPNDVVNFEVGMVVAADTTDGTSGAINAGTTTVTAVDRDAGTVTLASAAALTGFADNDYLFVAGDFGLGVKGLDAWLPSSAPGATAFFGVDRSSEPTRLGGIRYSDSYPLKEKLIRAFSQAYTHGARKCNKLFVNPLNFADIVVAVGDMGRIDQVKSSDGMFGFESIHINTAIGRVDVVPDPDCPRNVGYALDMSTWAFVSRGKAPRNVSLDGGGEWLRAASSDGVEARFGWYGQLGCRAPGKNMRIALA